MVMTASSEQLIIMLYDGAIQWLQMAKREIATYEGAIPDWTNYNKYMHMATRVISHLQESLDFNVKDDTVNNLYAVYNFIYNKLSKATIAKKEEDVEAIIEFLKDLRGTWAEAIKIQQQKLPIAQ